MADQIYLSLWFPNFRLDALPRMLVAVLKEFEPVGGAQHVHAATVYPVSWNETPIYQRIYGPEETGEAMPEAAVAAAFAGLHDDLAFEFEMQWDLWVAEVGGGLDPIWKQEPRIVRVNGFGPYFEEGFYEQNGHIRVDFGVDTPFVENEVELDADALQYVRQNVTKLVDITRAIEEKCAPSGRLLWSESGESLAQKLIARLGRVN